jgi:hypothetical protein
MNNFANMQALKLAIQRHGRTLNSIRYGDLKKKLIYLSFKMIDKVISEGRSGAMV